MEDSNHQNGTSTVDLQNAWRRFLKNTYTDRDLLLILRSFAKDDKRTYYYNVSVEAWKVVKITGLLEKEGDKEKYRREAVKLITAYEQQRKKSIRMRPAQKPVRKIRRIRTYWLAAACICVAVTTVWRLTKPVPQPVVAAVEVEAAIQYVEVATQTGERKTLYLPDSSKVTLNSNSFIRYPETFASDNRQVELKGQAFFEVTANPAKPFTVASKDVKVQVLGTVFDVCAYEEDLLLMVSVASGKVNVKVNETENLLEKDEQLRFNKLSAATEKMSVNTANIGSWMDGVLCFNRMPVQEVVNTLCRCYPQANIELAKGNYSNLISGKHDNKRLDAVLASVVASTGLKIKKENNKIILYKPN
jgi:ferric-dicitrate binding protein FerR (iron transport regulator)